jgi:nucleotide-binding universal stress UspA family protein
VPEANHVAFRRAVLALSGGPTDELIVRLACEYARPTRAELIAVHVVELDWTMPLDADVAEAVAEEMKVNLEAVLVQARDLGAAIVDEAAAREADLLILGLPYRTKFGGDFAIGRAVPYALRNAPCTVWVVREPIGEEAR